MNSHWEEKIWGRCKHYLLCISRNVTCCFACTTLPLLCPVIPVSSFYINFPIFNSHMTSPMTHSYHFHFIANLHFNCTIQTNVKTTPTNIIQWTIKYCHCHRHFIKNLAKRGPLLSPITTKKDDENDFVIVIMPELLCWMTLRAIASF